MARDKGTFFCARSKERRKSEGERERDPFTRPCIERLYSRLGFDTLELMISSSTGINSFSLLRAKYKPRLKERFNLIIFPVFFLAPLLCRATRSPSRFASASFRQFRIPRERTGGQTVRTGAAPRFSSRARHEERLSRGEDQKIRVEVNLHLVGCEPPAINLLPPFSILSIFFATWRFRTLSLSPFLSSPEISRIESSERILLTLFLFDPLLGEAK